MADAIAHRGPDGLGVYCDVENGLALAHRRLAIIDLTDAGKQPMTSADGRWVVAFNGEIYNYMELRGTLERQGAAPVWRGHSDTEVLLSCFAAWGFERTLQEANGMFAIAAWDRKERRLWLARDRMGEKPLYYGWQGQVLLFGSELKALAAHPAFERRLDRGALALYLRFAYVPAPYSIYLGIRKLKPGCYVSMGADTPSGILPEEMPYWRLPRPEPEMIGEADALNGLDALLRDAVAIRMRSDVPMGAFLSGGIDSSSIVALMQAQAGQPVRSFSIGFEHAGFDESRHAAAVAAHLGTEHTRLLLSPQDALAVIPSLGRMYDEPFADSSQIPTYLLAKLTRQHVAVSLSGDGGDELFAGYTRHYTFDALWGVSRRLPLRRAISAGLTGLPFGIWRDLPLLPSRLRRDLTNERLRKFSAVLDAADKNAYFASLVSTADATGLLREPAAPPETIFDRCDLDNEFDDPVLGMTYIDACTYLPDDVLAKVDRATMAVSLEGRMPMLDHRVVEFAAHLPLSLKVRNGVGKHLLRRLLDRYVPKSLTDRPKHGFAIPLAEWLRGPLRTWGEALIADGKTSVAAQLDAAKLRGMWQRHQSGLEENEKLWCALMLLAWGREWQPL